MAGTTQMGYFTFVTNILHLSQEKIFQVINQWILQVFMGELQGKWEQASWLFQMDSFCERMAAGGAAEGTMHLESGRQHSTGTFEDLQSPVNAANTSQMYSSTRRTSQLSPCD